MGGEQSGHIIFLDHATTGDGMIAALRVLAVMVAEQKPLSELARTMTRYPQVLLNFAVAQQAAVRGDAGGAEGDRAGRDATSAPTGACVVRYSGTESKARVMIEGTDEAGIRAQADEIAEHAEARALAG